MGNPAGIVLIHYATSPHKQACMDHYPRRTRIRYLSTLKKTQAQISCQVSVVSGQKKTQVSCTNVITKLGHLARRGIRRIDSAGANNPRNRFRSGAHRSNEN